MKDQYSPPKNAISIIKVSTRVVATILYNQWNVLIKVPNTVFNGNNLRLVPELFAALCVSSRIVFVPATECYPQLHNAEIVNETLESLLQHYLKEHQTGWVKLPSQLLVSTKPTFTATREGLPSVSV